MKSRQSGFTLIEIAIVMVIIGLLIGGVLKGQALIDNAKIKSVINDMNGVAAAYYGYYDRKKVLPDPDTNYNISTNNPNNTFWNQVRSAGLLTGDPTSLIPGANSMGGNIGVQKDPMGMTGNAVCTSVLSKYAQGIDTGLDDGLSSKGSVQGYSSVVGGAGAGINEVVLPASIPLVAGYNTNGYVVLCRQL